MLRDLGRHRETESSAGKPSRAVTPIQRAFAASAGREIGSLKEGDGQKVITESDELLESYDDAALILGASPFL